MLRDLLVVGVADNIQNRLLARNNLDFENARLIASAMESAAKNVSDIAAFSSTGLPAQPALSRVERKTLRKK